MLNIQIIFLFVDYNRLSADKQKEISRAVQLLCGRYYGCDPSEVATSMHNASSSSPKFDIVLAFENDRKRLNEGTIRGYVKRDLREHLARVIPANMGFRGIIGTQDGHLPVPEAPAAPAQSKAQSDELDYVARAKNYRAIEPEYSFDMVKMPAETREAIENALARISLEKEVFDDWGLYAIMPNPISAMSFYGPPGTGKTLAAHAIASQLKKPLLRTSYADIESKYHGEGPKNVCAIFEAARQQDAVLFIDEADSLLSKRLTSVSQGSEQAINSMRSQLLICLEQFHGVVLFATNLVVNYDKAFLSRLINIEFKLPDEQMRKEIWDAHLYPSAGRNLKIPLAEDVDTAALGRNYPACGRNIRNAVVMACVSARRHHMPQVTQEMLARAIAEEIKRSDDAVHAKDHTATDTVRQVIADEMNDAVNEKQRNVYHVEC